MPHTRLQLQDLRRILRESAGVAAEADIDGDISDTDFQDLGYDSIAIMEVATRISREYGVPIDDDALGEATTPRMLLELVNNGSQHRQG